MDGCAGAVWTEGDMLNVTMDGAVVITQVCCTGRGTAAPSHTLLFWNAEHAIVKLTRIQLTVIWLLVDWFINRGLQTDLNLKGVGLGESVRDPWEKETKTVEERQQI